jgi:GntR family transcriptional regulator / MocR family aminotransferase
MRVQEFGLLLDKESAQPLFLQIVRAISEDITRGRLKPGDPLPGSRTLATSLGLNRNTVIAAYRELSSEGWIKTSVAQGTFVSREFPEVKAQRFSAIQRGVSQEVFPLSPLQRTSGPSSLPTLPPGISMLGGWVPDQRLVPVDELSRAFRRVLRGKGLLGYGDTAGYSKLRVVLAAMLSQKRSVAATKDTMIITQGSQQALYLISRAIFSPGDVIVVEALGYPPAWDAFRSVGVRIIPVAVDKAGLDVASLEELCKKENVRAVYVTPHHQFPTTVTMTASRRLALLKLARARRFAIIEDDYDHEFHYEGRPLLPLASANPSGSVIYIGSLSKVLAPGLRLGYIVAAPTVVERLLSYRALVDRHGAPLLEAAVAEMIEDGDLLRHTRRMRRIYTERRDALCSGLRATFGEALSFSTPSGGMALWCGVHGVDPDEWAKQSLAYGALMRAGRALQFDGAPTSFVRLGFSCVNEIEIKEMLRRLKAAFDACVAPQKL